MKAIETVYKGYKFRSRLEARWAVFFDTLNIKWEYEKEGFDLDGLWYLPDFWLPELRYWIEIKGEEPTKEENRKCAALAKAIDDDGPDKKVCMFIGPIPLPPYEETHAKEYAYLKQDNSNYCFKVEWVQCIFCHKFYINYIGRTCGCEMDDKKLDLAVEICEALAKYGFESGELHRWWEREKVELVFRTHNTPRLIAAYTAARQAQF